MKTSSKFLKLLKFVLLLVVASLALTSFAKKHGGGGSSKNRGGQKTPTEQKSLWTADEVDKKPTLKGKAADPVYPPDSLKKKELGAVTLEFTVSSTGSVKDVKVVKQTNRAFGNAAKEAVAKWQYTPAKKGGKAVDCRMAYTLNFNPQNNGSGGSVPGQP